MLNLAHRVFTYDEFPLTRHSQTELVLNHFSDATEFSAYGPNVDIRLYISVSRILRMVAPVPTGLSVVQFLPIRYFAGVSTDWAAE